MSCGPARRAFALGVSVGWLTCACVVVVLLAGERAARPHHTVKFLPSAGLTTLRQPQAARLARPVLFQTEDPTVIASRNDTEEPENDANRWIPDTLAEEEYLEQVKLEVKSARSEEAVAAERKLAIAAAATLHGNEELKADLATKDSVLWRPKPKLAKILKKQKGTLAFIGEMVRSNYTRLGTYDLNDIPYMCNEYRVGGATAMMANVGFEDSLDPLALETIVKEQSKKRGEVPGPLPAIARIPLIDPLQLAEVRSQGAKGAIVSLAVAGKNKAAELMAAAGDLDLELLVRVTSAEELSAAIELGAKMIVFGDLTMEEAAQLLEILRAQDDTVVAIADFPFYDVRGAWRVRRAGFNAIISGRSFVEVIVRDVAYPRAVIKALLSKGSVKYGVGLQGYGKEEGAKETLGMISMN